MTEIKRFIPDEREPDSVESSFENSSQDVYQLSPHELARQLKVIDAEGSLSEYLGGLFRDDPDRAIAFFSYWEKYFSKKVRATVEDAVVKQREGQPHTELPLGLEKKYSRRELKIIMDNLIALQPTFGCKKGCPYCMVDAVYLEEPESMPHDQVMNSINRREELNAPWYRKLVLHYASEPEDYSYTSDGREYRFGDLLTDADASKVEFVTRSDDESFLRTVAGSNAGKRSLNNATVSRRRRQNDAKKGEDYFPNMKTKKQTRKTDHHKGIGLSLVKDRSLVGKQFSNGFPEGVLITPRGLYSIIEGAISDQCPQGQLVVPFEGFKKEGIFDQAQIGNDLADITKNAASTFSFFTRFGGTDFTFLDDGRNIIQVKFDKKTFQIKGEPIAFERERFYEVERIVQNVNWMTNGEYQSEKEFSAELADIDDKIFQNEEMIKLKQSFADKEGEIVDPDEALRKTTYRAIRNILVHDIRDGMLKLLTADIDARREVGRMMSDCITKIVNSFHPMFKREVEIAAKELGYTS
ncbi:MAG: hypothetical protein HQ530_04900 [Parcubacteria group bacterium]|nr:hypothetical protein [Parcubacteria group bacterium]